MKLPPREVTISLYQLCVRLCACMCRCVCTHTCLITFSCTAVSILILLFQPEGIVGVIHSHLNKIHISGWFLHTLRVYSVLHNGYAKFVFVVSAGIRQKHRMGLHVLMALGVVHIFSSCPPVKAQVQDTRSPSAAPGGVLHLSAHLLGTERQPVLWLCCPWLSRSAGDTQVLGYREPHSSRQGCCAAFLSPR